MPERESKFSPGPTFRLPSLDDPRLGLVATDADELRLHAVYYDTDDLRLARAGASFRYRDDQGWVVKLPVGGWTDHDPSAAREPDDVLARHELEVPGGPESVPPQARDLVLALVRRAELRPIARLSTVRRRIELHDARGEQVAEVVDDEVSVLDGARLVARFRELEVEFAAGATREVEASLVARLRGAGAGRPHLVPKIARALGPRALDPPDGAVPELESDDPAVEVVRTAIASALRRLVAHDPGVRLGDDPEDVHQARVATRRLRSDLRTFGPLLDESWRDSIRDELKWLGGLLGDVRDTEVLRDRLEASLAEGPDDDRDAGERLLEGLGEHRDAARFTLLGALRSDRYLAILDRLVDATVDVPLAPEGADEDENDDEQDADDLAALVRKPWRKLKRAVRELDDDSPDPALHAVRILAKRCRYAAEAVAPSVGKEARRFARAIARLQDVLGEHQDAVTAEAWLREHAATSDARAAFVAGELAARERAAADESRDEWPDVWARARKPKLRRWL